METATQKIEHSKKTLAIDPTNKISAYDWLCYNYSGQLIIDFNGVYDIKNSNLAKDNGTSVQYDFIMAYLEYLYEK